MDTMAEIRQTLETLFSTQKFAVLSTYGDARPYASLVAFAATDDLKYIIFTTDRATRKYKNLAKEPQVALLIDDRTNEEEDFSSAVAATALGAAEEASGPRRTSCLDLYLRKHPRLEEFVSSPSSALLAVRIEKYYVVSGFRNVRELLIAQE